MGRVRFLNKRNALQRFWDRLRPRFLKIWKAIAPAPRPAIQNGIVKGLQPEQRICSICKHELSGNLSACSRCRHQFHELCWTFVHRKCPDCGALT
jgi:hypothetical protein